MRVLERTHSAFCTFTVSLMGEQYAHRFYVGVVISTPTFTGPGQLLSVEACSEWPNGDRQTLPALVYALLLKADSAITRSYEQMRNS